MRRLIMLAMLVPSIAFANIPKTDSMLMQMISQAPIALVACDRLGYAENCKETIENRIIEEMTLSGFSEVDAVSCAVASTSKNIDAGRLCAEAFGLGKEYEEFIR